MPSVTAEGEHLATYASRFRGSQYPEKRIPADGLATAPSEPPSRIITEVLGENLDDPAGR